MKLEKRFNGCKKLISYLTTHKQVSQDRRNILLDDLFQEPDFRSWIDAYKMIESVESLVYATLLELDKEQSYPPFPLFPKKIREGFRDAMETGSEELMKKLEAMVSSDSADLERLVNRYLPENTPISVTLVPTIDGFNTGMVRENCVYYSINAVEPDSYNSQFLAHEVHHIAVNYWFNRNPRWVKWFEMEGSPQRIVAELLKYIVSEGIANHLMFPNAVSLKGSSSENIIHNERIHELEKKYVRFLEETEEIVLLAFDGKREESRQLYRRTSIDDTGSGVPAGHYMSAKMFAQILREREESIIVDIIQNPWDFFNIYDGLNEKSFTFSSDFLQIISNKAPG